MCMSQDGCQMHTSKRAPLRLAPDKPGANICPIHVLLTELIIIIIIIIIMLVTSNNNAYYYYYHYYYHYYYYYIIIIRVGRLPRRSGGLPLCPGDFQLSKAREPARVEPSDSRSKTSQNSGIPGQEQPGASLCPVESHIPYYIVCCVYIDIHLIHLIHLIT